VLLAAVLVGLLVGGAIAALQGGSDGENQRAGQTSERSSTTDEPQQSTQDSQPSQSEEQQPAQSEETTPAPSAEEPSQEAPSGGDSTQLAQQGHSLIEQGDHAQAVSVLQRATSDCPVSRTDPCAYALYDLGVALVGAGRPDEAIPVFERRLENSDQRGAVQKALNQAKKAARES
jgi:tetratricopeptide (TPR) repeat protein